MPLRLLRILALVFLAYPALATAGAPEPEEETPEALSAKLELKRKALEVVIDEMTPTLEGKARVAPSEAQTKQLAAALSDLLDAQEEAAQFHRSHPFTSPEGSRRFQPVHPKDFKLLKRLTEDTDAQELAGVVAFNTLQFRRAAAEIEAQRVLYAIKGAGFALVTGKAEYMPPPCPDGSRAPSPGEPWFAGCRFIFQVQQAPLGGEKVRYIATARGVVAPVAGVEYILTSGPDFPVSRVPKTWPDLLPSPGAGPSNGGGAPGAHEPPIIWALRPLVSSIPVLDFRPDVMTEPMALSGPSPKYPSKASESRLEGLFVFKCVIGVDGRVSNCRIIKPLPYTEEVLDAYASQRYQPVTFQGTPIDCDYTFRARLLVPKP